METRFMQVMFSASEENDEQLTQQVADDIETAKENGSFEDEDVTYVNLGSGKVLVVDKENGESTVIEQNPENPEEFSLEGFENEQELDKYLHTLDGITPNEEVTNPVENIEDHMTGEDVISPNLEDGGLNPEAGHEPTVEELYEDGEEEEGEGEEHLFSLGTENLAIMKIFSDQNLYLRIFADVVTEDKPALVGDLKVEVDEDCPDAVIVTDIESGDQAKVTFDEERGPVVTETQKECCYSDYDEECEDGVCEEEAPEYEEEEGSEQYEPLFVVGINPESSELVNSVAYDEEAAEELANHLESIGLAGVEVFDCPEEARTHAADLLGEAGVSEVEQLAEPEEHTFSDCTVYITRYFSEQEEITPFMERLFSEAEDNVTDAQDEIEEAIADSKQTETEDTVITPIDDETAVVLDKETDEYTKVTLDGDEIEVEKISEEEADDLTKDLEVEDEEENDDEDQKEYSEFEYANNYIQKLYSDPESQEEVVDAIEKNEEVDNEDEVITPVDDETAVVYDKNTEEYTKVTLDGDDLKVDEITEEEATNLIDTAKEEEEVAKKFSTMNRFFAEVAEQAAPAPQTTVAPEVDPMTGNPVEAPVEDAAAEVAEPQESVEGIEDKALAAVQSIQEAANDAVLAIQQAKEAPAPGEEEDLREAQFCENENDFCEDQVANDTLGNWLTGNF